MMNWTIVNELNASLYKEAKIYWIWNKGWSSNLWLRLSKLGWTALRSPAGIRLFKDPQGYVFDTYHLSWPFALSELGKKMR